MPELSDEDRLSDVADVVQHIKEMDNIAVVREYKTRTDGPERTELKITLEVDHDIEDDGEGFLLATEDTHERINTVKNIVAELEGDNNGAEINNVIQAAVSEGMDEDSAQHKVEKLRRQGDVYEPTAGYIRTV
jgi:DNA replicative helicase MCM subunit Mcm2 (Cdc46/Mcm family)